MTGRRHHFCQLQLNNVICRGFSLSRKETVSLKIKNLNMLGMSSFWFSYAYQSQWRKKISLMSKGQRSKKLYFQFFPHLLSYYWTSRYEITGSKVFLIAHEFGCFVFWPPTQITFQEETEGQWKILWKGHSTQCFDAYL